jgi:hypothetical protein
VPHRGKPNAPYTLRAVADVEQVDVAELGAAVTAAGERAFGPCPADPGVRGLRVTTKPSVANQIQRVMVSVCRG